MKIVTGLLFFVLLGINSYGQQDARVIAEVAATNERAVKNAPFSAEAISESVQMLADGNRIVRSSTSKLYRNSEGRFRRETEGGSSSVFGTAFTYGGGISIVDPVAGHRLALDDSLRTARVIEMTAGQGISIAGRPAVGRQLTIAERAELEANLGKDQNLTPKQKAELAAKLRDAYKYELDNMNGAVVVSGSPRAVTAYGGNGQVALATAGRPLKMYESRSEELGTRDFEGVSADGTRTVTTIPEGAIGNERPIEIVYERWHSKELGIVVYSKHSDPRFGEQTYRVTNIVRAEPDPSLFAVPQGYKVVNDARPVYRVGAPPPAATAPSAVYTRPAKAPKAAAVPVKATKP